MNTTLHYYKPRLIVMSTTHTLHDTAISYPDATVHRGMANHFAPTAVTEEYLLTRGCR